MLLDFMRETKQNNEAMTRIFTYVSNVHKIKSAYKITLKSREAKFLAFFDIIESEIDNIIEYDKQKGKKKGAKKTASDVTKKLKTFQKNSIETLAYFLKRMIYERYKLRIH